VLSDRVRFLGHVPHDEMAALLGSADFLLQASLREWSGYTVLEALAVGALPVVTRIDAFEEITDGGRQGVLFPVGDPEAMARGVLALNLADLPARRQELQTYFEDRLSYAAMARRLEGIYARSLAERRSRGRSGFRKCMP
jgi:glycosyltransferase involved in cell wall biosynthesis